MHPIIYYVYLLTCIWRPHARAGLLSCSSNPITVGGLKPVSHEREKSADNGRFFSFVCHQLYCSCMNACESMGSIVRVASQEACATHRSIALCRWPTGPLKLYTGLADVMPLCCVGINAAKNRSADNLTRVSAVK